MRNYIGKFIVLDGTDGSGKATQTDLLVDKLRSEGHQVEIADFPQYGAKSAGMVEEYLNSKYGTAKKVGPYRASIFYACDRYDASFKIKQWLRDGKIVIANRYVTSNMAHQGGKISDSIDRKKFFKWVQNLEYKIFNIPRPDIVLILHVDAKISQKLVDNKGHRDYINGHKRDLHEADLEHLYEAEKTYLEIAKEFPGYRLIKCTENEQIKSREKIHELVYKEVNKIINPKSSKSIAPDFKHLHDQHLTSVIEEHNSQLKIERLSPAVKLPTKAHPDDAGFDLYSRDYYSLLPSESAIINTGIKIAIPSGLVGLIWDKSGIARQGLYSMAGVIDSGFRGEVTVNLINLSHDIYHIAPGQKVAQLLIQKVESPEILEGFINDQTDRGDGRFGSTGLF